MSILTKEEKASIIQSVGIGGVFRREGSTSERIVDATIEAVLAKLEQQQPVAFVTEKDVADFGKSQGESAFLFQKSGKWNVPLYVRPVPQSADRQGVSEGWRQGSLVTVNQDPYPNLGGLFVQFWDGDQVAARIYGNDHETLRQRCAMLTAVPEAPAQSDAAEAVNETNAILAGRYFELLKVVETYEKSGVTCQTFRHFVDRPCGECNAHAPTHGDFDDCDASPDGKHSESWYANNDCDYCKTGKRDAPTPTEEDAYQMGAKGGEFTDHDRKLFAAWWQKTTGAKK